MDVKLESLIEKIKKDGIEEAKAAKDGIIQKADQEAKDIIKTANVQADKIVKEAKNQALRLKNNTESALKQAARDLMLTLKEEIKSLLGKILKRGISEALSPDFIKQLIIKIVEGWHLKRELDLEVLVNKADREKLEDLLISGLKKDAKEKIEIKIGNVGRGFHIGEKKEGFYYDLTDEGISELLKEFLNPAISKLLDTKE